MNKLLDYSQFTELDNAYFADLERARGLDPIEFGAGYLALKMQLKEPVDTGELVELAATARTVMTDDDPARRIAAFRDYDKVFGYFAGRPPREVPTEVQEVFASLDLAHPRPRANAYEYFFGSDLNNPNHAYTNDRREIGLMDVVRISVGAGHAAVGHLLSARQLLREGGQATDDLVAAHEQIERMRKEMMRSYRVVTPEFFTLGMTRRWREVDINGQPTQGPNPSHTAWMAVDRFTSGSFDPLLAEPHMADAYAVRRSSLPDHLNGLLDLADEMQDDETILELAMRSGTEEDRAIAADMLSIIRRSKVAHKSYADKGLASKGGQLTPGRPDALSDNITHVRGAEAAL